jgi:hypothetical protein
MASSNGKVDQLRAHIDVARLDIDQLKRAIADVQRTLDRAGLPDALNGVKGPVSKLETRIADLEQKAAALDTTAQQLEPRLSAVEGQLPQLETRVDELQQKTVPQLQTRIDALEKKSARQREWAYIIKALTPAGTAVGALLVLLWGIHQYYDTNRNEFQKTIWKEQYALYQEACASASAIAVADKLESAKEQRDMFWKLYYGRLSILEHPAVKKAMQHYGHKLRDVEQGKALPASLNQLAYHLARECRGSLAKTWNPKDLGDVEAGKDVIPEEKENATPASAPR